MHPVFDTDSLNTFNKVAFDLAVEPCIGSPSQESQHVRTIKVLDGVVNQHNIDFSQRD